MTPNNDRDFSNFMNILLLNYPYLQKEYEKLGHSVISAGKYQECDIYLANYTFSNLEDKTNLTKFDVVIFSDGLDDHPIFSEMKRFTCPTVYIGIDSTINFFWQKYYAQSFDLVFFDQPAEYEKLRKKHSAVYPLLLGFDSEIYNHQNEGKIYDITFVGRFNSSNRIKRTNLINLIRSHNFKINVIDGKKSSLSPAELAKVYSQSKIVLNETLFPSLNLRLFEILGSGALAFTEKTCAYTKYYFKDNKEIILYTPEDVIEKLKYYLKNDNERQIICGRSLEKAHRYHRDINRAETVIARIMEIKNKRKIDPQSAAVAAMQVNLKWPASRFSAANSQIIENYITEKDRNEYFTEENLLTYLKILYYANKKDSVKKIIEGKFPDQIHNAELITFIFWFSLENGMKDDSFIYFEKIMGNNQNNFLQQTINQKGNLENILPELYYYCGKYLFNRNIRINYGFTTSALPPLYFSAFDFFKACSDFSNAKFEISINYMIQILIGSKAYDFVALLYDRLCQKYPANIEYRELREYYERKSYKI